MLVSINVYNVAAALTITPPSGWTTLVSDNGGGNNHHYVFYKVHTGSEAGSYSFTWTGASTNAACIIGYRGAKSVINTFAVAENAVATSTFDAPSVTASVAGVLITTFGIDDNQAGLPTFTPPSGQTERADISDPTVDTTDIAISLNDEAVGAGATGNKTSTCSNTGIWSSASILLEGSGHLLASLGVGG